MAPQKLGCGKTGKEQTKAGTDSRRRRLQVGLYGGESRQIHIGCQKTEYAQTRQPD
ncbi:hypothetical protein MUTS16_46880 [Escherichia coli]|nr:hypothetical protein MUTS16_46880 [Escherichia coli]